MSASPHTDLFCPPSPPSTDVPQLSIDGEIFRKEDGRDSSPVISLPSSSSSRERYAVSVPLPPLRGGSREAGGGETATLQPFPTTTSNATNQEQASPLLTLDSVTKSFPRKDDTPLEILHPTTLTIDRGERVAIVGPSGSGKSTLLSILGTLSMPTGGEVRYDGRNVADMGERARSALRATTIGFVFQQFHLMPSVSALENVMTALQYTATPRREWRTLAIEALRQVGLGERVDHKPGQLSGGEQQRVAIARALVKKPSIIFADEPTGALDTETGRAIVDLLLDIGRTGTALAVVTHDLAVAARFERVLTIRDGVVSEDDNVRNAIPAEITDIANAQNHGIPQPIDANGTYGGERA